MKKLLCIILASLFVVISSGCISPAQAESLEQRRNLHSSRGWIRIPAARSL